MRSLPRRARWAVPVGAVAAVGLVVAGSALAGARGAPRLPARSTAQLLAAVDAPSARLPAMTAVVQETASLGLPNLPGSSDATSPASLLSGTHTFMIWYDGPARVRIAMPVPLGETDLRRSGRDVWLWNSRSNQATHYVLPAGAAGLPEVPAPAASAPTPQQAARQVLAAVGPTTAVGLQPDVTVAGQAAYQISLAPRDARSLIGQVRIAIDAEYGLPLRVQVFARGAPGPAFGVGYTSIAFGRPAASEFAFTAPPGAKVTTIRIPNGTGAAGAPPGLPLPGVPIERQRTVGTCELTMKQLSGKLRLPAGLPKAQRAALLKSLATSPAMAREPCIREIGTTGGGVYVVSGGVRSGATAVMAGRGCHGTRAAAVPASAAAAGSGWQSDTAVSAVPVMTGGPRVIGRGWLSVLVLPAGFATFGPPGSAVVYHGSSGSSAYSSSLTVSDGPGGPAVGPSGLDAALLAAARPVHGAWGSGRLLRTSLLSVLITGGQVLIGAVQPSVLFAGAAHLR